jgi:hypothetical protein
MSETIPATPAPIATASTRTFGASRSDTSASSSGSSPGGTSPIDRSVVDDGADRRGHRGPDERGDHHRPDDGGRRVEEESGGRDHRRQHRHQDERLSARDQLLGFRLELLSGDAVFLAFGRLGVLGFELVEPIRDDRLGGDDDRDGSLVDADRSKPLEDRFDGRLRQRKRRHGRDLAVSRLVGDDVVDPFVVERADDRVPPAGRNRDLNESHGYASRGAGI